MTALAKVAVALKDVVVAGEFGASAELDAYLIALVAPTFAMQIIAASFTAAIVPVYVAVRDQEGAEAATKLVCTTYVLIGLVLTVASLLIIATAPLLLAVLGPGLDEQTSTRAQQLLLILAPVLVLTGTSAVYAALLNAEERFVAAALGPVVAPAAPLMAVVMFGGSTTALAVGTVLGFLVEAVIVAIALGRSVVPLLPRWHGVTPALRAVMRQYLPAIGAGSVLSSTLLVDLAMASTLGPGSVSSLSYGGKLVAFALGIGGVALGTAVFPHFSVLVAGREWPQIAATLRTWSRVVWAVTIPLTAVAILTSPLIVSAVFQRGAFTAADSRQVAVVQQLFLLQVPFYLLATLKVRLISALQRNSILLWASLISVGLNIGLNLLFMRTWGVAGIALSTSCVYAFSYAFVSLRLRALLRAPERSSAGPPPART